METWVIVATILGVTFGGSAIWGVVDTILSHRRKMARLVNKNGDQADRLALENEELRETISHLKDRVAVLETIATDPASQTAAEIERLR